MTETPPFAPALDIQFPDDDIKLVEFVPVQAAVDSPAGLRLPPSLHTQLCILAIHDGDCVPRSFLRDAEGEPIALHRFEADYIHERDWGSAAVAARIASSLGLPGFHRVRLARVLMDFGRFPGQTPPEADHLHRFALNYPFSRLLGYSDKRRVLTELYDHCSDRVDEAVRGKMTVLSVHTYDSHNASGTQRPDVSVITRSVAYQTESRMPTGVFDPLYPDLLAEYTADRILRDRLALTLEKGRLRVAHNYPYLLPEGSVEVRSQVWFFFNWLRGRYGEQRPESVGDPAFDAVWDMLLDTNLRSGESEMLRSYLHLFRTAPQGKKRLFERAVKAYAAIERFLNSEVVLEYRLSSRRPSSMALEVRKDLVFDFDGAGRPIGVLDQPVRHVGDQIARALHTYLIEDLPER